MSNLMFYIFIGLLTYVHSYTTQFCKFQCGIKHTVCRRGSCGPSRKCGTKFAMKMPWIKHRKQFVRVLNDLRDKTASEKEKKFLPPASNMKILAYSKELEFVAQCWANACSNHKDECRSITNYEDVSQLVYISPSNIDISNDTALIHSALRSWINEEEFIDTSWLKHYPFKEDKPGNSYKCYKHIVFLNVKITFKNTKTFSKLRV